ncbi:hypothetical protein D3C72_2112960 [compost metagenome]
MAPALRLPVATSLPFDFLIALAPNPLTLSVDDPVLGTLILTATLKPATRDEGAGVEVTA